MTKTVYAGTLLIILTLIAGSIWAPGSFIMTFVSTETSMMVARVVLSAMLITLLVTNPPRSYALRALLGLSSAVFFTWAINYALSGTIAIADAILFIHASISFALAAVESGARRIAVEGGETEDEIPVRLAQAAARGAA